MKPKEYEKNALVTESCDFSVIRTRIDDRMIRLLHAGLGLSSELSELVDAYAFQANSQIDWVNISEEAADLAWYCVIAVNALGFDHNQISDFEYQATDQDLLTLHSKTSLQATLESTIYFCGNFNDMLKKHLLYGRELNMDKIKQTLQQICVSISGICVVSGTSIEKARETNIAKLRARYGDKFTEFDALNRDLDVERKILES